MIHFTDKELDYIKKDFDYLLYSEEEVARDCRKQTDEESIKNIKYFLDNLDIVHDTEEINKKFIDTVYWNCGLWCWFDNDNSPEEVEEFLGKDFAGIYEKITCKES